MAEVQLVGGVLPDIDDRVLLLHRSDHNQLELPGGRIEDGEVPLQALARTLHSTLGIAVTAAHALNDQPQPFRQGVVEYTCRWFTVTGYEGKPYIMEPYLYSDQVRKNLFARNIGRAGLSPNVEQLAWALQNNTVHLRR